MALATSIKNSKTNNRQSSPLPLDYPLTSRADQRVHRKRQCSLVGARRQTPSIADGATYEEAIANAQTATAATGAKTFAAVEKNACSIDAMLNSGTCVACQ